MTSSIPPEDGLHRLMQPSALFILPYTPSITKPRSLEFISTLSEKMLVHVAYLDMERHPDADLQISRLEARGVIFHRLNAGRFACALRIAFGFLLGRSLRSSIYDSDALARRLNEIARQLGNLRVIHVDRLRALPLAKKLNQNMILLDLTDLMHLDLAWRMTREKWPMRLLRRRQWRLYQTEERRVSRTFSTLLASGKHLVEKSADSGDIEVVPNIVRPQKVSFRHREPGKICFVGNMDYWPNKVGIRAFLNNCWRRILAQAPETRLTILGNRAEALGRLVRKFDNVSLVGFQDDLQSRVGRHELVIVPLPFCNGFSNKVYDAVLKFDTPVMMSREVAELIRNDGSLDFCTAASDREWIDGILAFLESGDKEQFLRRQHETLTGSLDNDAYLRLVEAQYCDAALS